MELHPHHASHVQETRGLKKERLEEPRKIQIVIVSFELESKTKIYFCNGEDHHSIVEYN